ncbi:MAG: right-handed parallel beta-helix repeat-containing protein [Planctomycetes bacterium]|nr:right-handed parallel beta-helix repeat-containing protein [Planctomycetota bacterium]
MRHPWSMLVLLAVLAVSCTQPAGGRWQVALADPAQLVLTPGLAQPAASGGLALDTRSSPAEWNICARTAPGRLVPGTTYHARVTCRIEEQGEDAYLFLLVRPFAAGDAFADLSSAPVVGSGRERTVTLRFTVPAGRGDYAVQIHTRRQLRAQVSAVVVAEGSGDIVLPVADPGQAVALPPLPTGAEDFAIDAPRPSASAPASVADFGADPAAADNSAAFARAIAHCRAGGAPGLVVPTGTYRFTAEQPIAFEGLSDFTFDGRGSTLVFLKAKGDLLRIAGCRRALFRDVAIDWDWERDPLASVVRAEAAGAGHLDLRFIDHARFPRRDLRVADIEQLDPATLSVGCEGALNAGFEFFRGRSPVPRTEWLGDDLLRLHLTPAQGRFGTQVRPGTLFRMRHYVYDMNGVSMRDNAHLTFSGVDLRSCPGHAFVTDGDQHHWQFLRTNVARPPGSRRPITCTADHHHVARSQGYFRMEGCEFSLGGDDCLNVHDTTAFAQPHDARTLRTRNLRGGGALHPGDPIELRQDDYAPAGWSAPLAAISAVDAAAGTYDLAFDRPLPAATGDGFVLFNRRYGTRQVVVRDCHFHDNRARGLLLLGSDMTVENNRFVHNQMGAIKIETGYTFDVWSEGYGAANLVIRGNRFEQPNPMGSYPDELRPAIYLSVYLRTDPSRDKTRFPILRDILIEGNRFTDAPGAIAYVCSAANVVIRGNTVEALTARRDESPFRGWIGVSHASGVYVTGNTWLRSPLMPAPAVTCDPETTSAVHSWGNTLR